jgi:alpha-glucuronidase
MSSIECSLGDRKIVLKWLMLSDNQLIKSIMDIIIKTNINRRINNLKIIIMNKNRIKMLNKWMLSTINTVNITQSN